MPFSLLIAIFLAFGFELQDEPGLISQADLRRCLLETAGGVILVGVLAFALGQSVAAIVARKGEPTPAIRRLYAWASRLVDALVLVVFAWIIHEVGWRAAVERGLGLGDSIVIDELLIVLPYLLAQVLAWWGLYAAESRVRARRGVPDRGRYLILKARQGLGLVLPVAFVFALGQDLIVRRWPGSAENPWAQMGSMAAMGSLMLVLSPAFVRLTWPTRPLPGGPLRDRLERLSVRLRFRCTDILVWDTGQAVVNAGVTGALPWFRYVLLTDALIEHLNPHEVEAVFGHEVGHIAHRHLSYFGFFFLGSIGVMALADKGVEICLGSSPLAMGLAGLTGADELTVAFALQSVGLLGCLGLYFLVVFGFLSRRFERQADVYGCRAVSCGRSECPPHADLNGKSGSTAATASLCPVGIRLFAGALSGVASLNGMDRESRWAWRHGSIAQRIAFLEGLEGRPEVERRFQCGVNRLRIGLAMVLASAVVVAAYTDALARIH